MGGHVDFLWFGVCFGVPLGSSLGFIWRNFLDLPVQVRGYVMGCFFLNVFLMQAESNRHGFMCGKHSKGNHEPKKREADFNSFHTVH